MNRMIAALVCAACAVGITTPAAARHKTLPERYSSLYRQVAKRHGARAPGRNIVKQGVRYRWVSSNHRGRHWAVRPARIGEIQRSMRMFHRWLAPPIPAGSYSWTPASGGWAIPAYIVMRESGGDYNAYNANGCVTRGSRGCIGAYQIATMHYLRGGVCYGLGRDPRGQDACAARLWDGGRGSSNWAQTR